MALQTPPSWLQAGTYTAEQDRLIQQAIYTTSGFVGAGALAITAQASPNMTVNVAAGYGAIVGNGSPNLGAYVCYNNAVTIVNIATADPSLARIDRIVMTVNDAAYSGSTNNVVFTAIAGTPAASPTAPATPSNSISLATIAVAAATTTITSANITDTRTAATSTLINALALPITGGTMTGNVTLVAGSTTVAPLKLTSGTLLTSGTIGGAVEYDGVAAYLNPNSSATTTTLGGRGLIPAKYVYALSASRSLTAGITTVQSMFNVGIPLAASTTYEIEISGSLTVTTSSATSNAIGVTLGYSGTVSTVDALAVGGANNASAISIIFTGSPSSANIYTSAAAQSLTLPFVVKGILRTSTAGTLTPQAITSAANATAFAVSRNTFVKVTPIGALATQAIGAWA